MIILGSIFIIVGVTGLALTINHLLDTVYSLLARVNVVHQRQDDLEKRLEKVETRTI